jgi:CO/xanthine dehydrogenase Mo-binding subunit
MTREEEFIGTNPRHPAEINIKTGVKKSGNILAREAKLIFDSGAYAGFGPHVASQAATLMGGPYRIPNIKIESYAVYTNNIVGGTCRAPGGPQAHFAVESQMDIIADTLGIDPVEIRIKNAMENGDKTPTGVVISSVSYKKILEELSNSINLKAPKKGEYIGRGIAGYLWGSTGYSSSASIRMNEDGSITLFIGATETGAGSTTTLAIIAAKELSIPFEDITVISGDTDRTPYDMGAIGSRITFTLGKAVRVAALELKSQILTTAAEKLEANIDDLIIEDRNIYVKGSPERSVSLSSIANIIYFVKGTLPTGTGRCIITNPPFDFQSVDGVTVPSKPHYTFGVQGVEIRVDINTGKIEPLRIIAVHDAGKIIFPLGIEGQIEGGIYQGLGFTLCEGGIFKDGRMLNPSFTDYHLLTSVDLPPMELIIMESAPYEVKGAGEPPVLPMAAAVANAIYDAVGVRIKDLPITPEKLFWGIKEKIFINKKIETT